MSFILSFCILTGVANSDDLQKELPMKIRLSFDEKEIIVRMDDNSVVEQIIKRLPADFEFIDFAGKEKIANFSEPLLLTNAPRGMIASAGKMFIYAPWGNMGFFYNGHSDTIDKNLIPLGEVESGLKYLSGQKGGFTARMELFEN